MKKSMKKSTETKTLCRELHVGELDCIYGGTVDVPTNQPRPTGPK